MGPLAVGSAIGGAAVAVGSGALGAVSNTLSFAAELVRAAGGGASAAGSSATESQKAALEQRADALRDRIQQQLSAAGITLSQPVELQSNGQGGIAVAPPNPQQADVEAALGSNVLLEQDFNQLASDYSNFVSTNSGTDLPATFAITIPQTQ